MMHAPSSPMWLYLAEGSGKFYFLLFYLLVQLTLEQQLTLWTVQVHLYIILSVNTTIQYSKCIFSYDFLKNIFHSGPLYHNTVCNIYNIQNTC